MITKTYLSDFNILFRNEIGIPQTKRKYHRNIPLISAEWYLFPDYSGYAAWRFLHRTCKYIAQCTVMYVVYTVVPVLSVSQASCCFLTQTRRVLLQLYLFHSESNNKPAGSLLPRFRSNSTPSCLCVRRSYRIAPFSYFPPLCTATTPARAL